MNDIILENDLFELKQRLHNYRLGSLLKLEYALKEVLIEKGY